jgi:endonuclease G
MSLLPAGRPALLKLLQVSVLLALGFAVFLGGIVASVAIGETWWPGIAAAVAYLGLISLVFLGDRDAWIIRTVRVAWSMLASTVRRAGATLVLLGVVIGVLTPVLPWPPDNVIIVLVYEDAPLPGKYKEGAEIEIRRYAATDASDDEIEKGTTDEEGTARIAMSQAGLMRLIISLEQRGRKRTGAIVPFEVKTFPHSIPIDVALISEQSWIDHGAEAPVEALLRPRSAALERSFSITAIPEIRGSPADIARHLPFGILGAPVLVAHEDYAMGYDPDLRIARWVAYAIKLGVENPVERPPWGMRPDPLAGDLPQGAREDYSASGYDRGNLVTFTDLKRSGAADPTSAFFATAIAPQTPVLNRLVLVAFERRGWDLIKTVPEVFVRAGTIVAPTDGEYRYFSLGENRIAVPTHIFRIMAWMEGGEWRALSALIPNEISLEKSPNPYLTSIDRIEELSGLDFFKDLPDAVEGPLESTVWPLAGDRPENAAGLR